VHRARRAGHPRPAPPPPAQWARLRCWSERPEDCAAIAERVLKAGSRVADRQPASGWTQDVQLTVRRATALPETAGQVRQFVDELRLHRFRARVSLQGARREWIYTTDDAAPGSPPPAPSRLAQGTLRRVKEMPDNGVVELSLIGAGTKVLQGTEQRVDGLLRNLAGRVLTIELTHGCDLDVAVAPRGSDRMAALSPCADAPQTLHLAAADSFEFRGADVPSDATGSFNAWATLVGTVDGRPVQLRTKPLRIEFRKAGKSELADWATPRPGCTPAPLGKPGPGELAGTFMVGLAEGVDAEAFARYLVRERKLRVSVSTPHYLRIESGEDAAAVLACLGGVQRVVRDVEGKRD
jgi:hypothetical protein